VRAYLDVVRAPGVLNVTASQLFARLPLGMLSLAVLLHVQARTGSYALAGAVVACMSIGEAAAMPVTARLLGRFGIAPTLLAAALVSSISMVTLAFVTPSAAVALVLGALIGASVPPMMPAVRALYPQMVPKDGVRALFALDTTAQEVIWVIGPVAATFLASLVSTAIPLVASAAVTLSGTVWFLLGARRLQMRIARSATAFGRVLTNRAVILAMAASLAMVASYMALEIGVLAMFAGHGIAAGVALATAGLGSLIGGFAMGHRRLGVSGLVTALAIVATGTALFGVVDGYAWQLAALFLSGVGFAPALSALYFMVSQEVDELSATEAFGWLNSAALAGGAVGTGIAGVVTDIGGPSWSVIAAVALAVFAMCAPLVARAGGPVGGLSIQTEGIRTEATVCASGSSCAD
jgi:MFS family permease